MLGRTAALELRGVDGNKSASPSMIRRARAGRLPRNLEMFEQRDGSPLIVLRKPVITGENITDARPGYDQNNRRRSTLDWTRRAAKK